MTDYMAGAEPFTFEGDETGVLVIHGFTGSPQSMRYLGEELHSRYGFTVVCPALPGHGTTPEAMAETGYLDWLGAVEAELKALAARKRRVFVTGLSMGGTLTLNLAARFGDTIAAIAPISAAAGPMPDPFIDLMALNPRPDFVPGIGSDIKAEGVTEVAYDRTPVICLREIAALMLMTWNMLPRITCPTLVIQAEEDHVVPQANEMEIVTRIRADDIRLQRLHHSYHVATLDNDKDLIVRRVGDFFREIAAS
ncbi:alpha/beta hydrolase [Acidimangrovimonas sediminis]|uniref:alpha/beta hydrolase n=1 Tax=Acidimangrovimonas sediminis TaxID=2056283 RepID=UPI000C7F821A|nr:alpha/beta fold hydrolase [Acidimangrovimonas sediminis]